jgi:hypothetical protein
MIERFGTHFVTRICFVDADKRRKKSKCKKTFTCFLLTYTTAAPVAMMIMITMEEKKENHVVDNK